MPDINGWTEWGKHVLLELERLNTCYEKLIREQGKTREEIASLKVKAGVWGLVAGCIPVAIAIIIRWGSW